MWKVLAAAFLVCGVCATVSPAAAPLATPETSSLPDAANTIAAPAQPANAKLYDTFIAREDWEADGYIAGDESHRTMISAGDLVFLDIGSDRLKPGMRCAVYRRLGKSRDPKTGEFLGYEMTRIGTLEATDDIAEETATARVLLSSDPIQVGDAVKVETGN